MERFAWKGRIKPGMQAEYKRRHDEIWPEMKQVLKERKIILLPGLGRLRATKENNFFFVPEEDLDIYPDGFALKPVSLKNIQR